MRRGMGQGFVVAVCLLTMVANEALCDQNWGHWRGALGNGIAVDAKPPTEWSASENIKWKVPIPGRGSGSPVVWDSKVFVVSAEATDKPVESASAPTDEDTGGAGRRNRRGRRGRPAEPLSELAFKLFCFSRDDGSLLWERTAVVETPHQETHSTNGFASASPCTDGEHVYASFGSRGLYCYTMDGELKWKKTDFPKMTTRNGFGEGSSPLLHEDRLLVPWDHEGPSALYAIDKKTGDTIWKADRDEPSCWATPIVVELDGKKQVVMNGENFARSYNYETGEELWRCAGQTARPVATPVAQGDLVYVGSGFRGAYLGAFRLDGKGDIEGSDHVVWTIERDTPDIASLLLSGDRLYFFKGKSGILSCVNAKTGERLFSNERVPELNTIYASPIAANGYVYLTARNGVTTVIKDSSEFEVVASNSLGETVDATPAPVGNQLLIRGERHLFCVESAN